MANINFCGIEILDPSQPAIDDNLGEYVDTTNSYKGEPVIDHCWKNDPDFDSEGNLVSEPTPEHFPCSKGGELIDDLTAVDTDWENFDPKQATHAYTHRVVFQETIDPENFGKSHRLNVTSIVSPYTGEEEELIDPATKWQLATPEEVEAAKEEGTLKTYFKFEKLSTAEAATHDVVAVCVSGLYTYYKPVSSGNNETPAGGDNQQQQQNPDNQQQNGENQTPSGGEQQNGENQTPSGDQQNGGGSEQQNP